MSNLRLFARLLLFDGNGFDVTKRGWKMYFWDKLLLRLYIYDHHIYFLCDIQFSEKNPKMY